MTLIELHDKLGEQIDYLTNPEIPYSIRKQHAELALIVSSLAKQTINNADVVLRGEKLVAEGKLANSGIERLIGRLKKDDDEQPKE